LQSKFQKCFNLVKLELDDVLGATNYTETLEMIIKKIQDLSTPVLIIQEQIDQVQPKIWNKKKELRDILEDILCEFNDIENKRANLKQIEVKANKLATEILEIKKQIEEI
jgi:chromosome segregation ATPase